MNSVLRGTSGQLADLPAGMRDGETLCRLILALRPNMTGVQAAVAKAEPEQRLAAVFATASQQLNVPMLLDSQGGNKKLHKSRMRSLTKVTRTNFFLCVTVLRSCMIFMRLRLQAKIFMRLRLHQNDPAPQHWTSNVYRYTSTYTNCQYEKLYRYQDSFSSKRFESSMENLLASIAMFPHSLGFGGRSC
jgi:hypothetical protein